MTNKIANHIPPARRGEFLSNVEEVVKPELMKRYAHAEIIIQPLSFTTYAHTGPGTGAVAFLPDMEKTY